MEVNDFSIAYLPRFIFSFSVYALSDAVCSLTTIAIPSTSTFWIFLLCDKNYLSPSMLWVNYKPKRTNCITVFRWYVMLNL